MFSFPKEQRLRQREIIAKLPAQGKVLFKYPIKAYYSPTEAGLPRYAIAVPKKSFKRAVKRNLLKRRIRESLRLNQKAILGDFAADYLLVYIGKDICSSAEIQAAVCEILDKSSRAGAEGDDHRQDKKTSSADKASAATEKKIGNSGKSPDRSSNNDDVSSALDTGSLPGTATEKTAGETDDGNDEV